MLDNVHSLMAGHQELSEANDRLSREMAGMRRDHAELMSQVAILSTRLRRSEEESERRLRRVGPVPGQEVVDLTEDVLDTPIARGRQLPVLGERNLLREVAEEAIADVGVVDWSESEMAAVRTLLGPGQDPWADPMVLVKPSGGEEEVDAEEEIEASIRRAVVWAVGGESESALLMGRYA